MKNPAQPLAASDVEKAFSNDFKERMFASLCNDLVWASANRNVPSAPSFTERTSAKDHGIDASWDIDSVADLPATTLLGPGWNVYQYKQRDAFSSNGRNAVISNLRLSLHGELKRLYEETGRRPSQYVLFTNLDLLHGQKEKQTRKALTKKGTKVAKAAQVSKPCDEAIREALLDGYDAPESVTVVVVGAAELKSFLNDLPHIRAVYFGKERFASWEQAWAAHAAENPIRGVGGNQNSVPLVSHATPLEQLRVAFADPQVRVAVITGLEGVGKSRLALEATRDRMTSTIFALDRDVTPSEIGELILPGRTLTVVVNDPTPEVASTLVRAAITASQPDTGRVGWKLVVTVPVRQGAAAPNYGIDSRVRYIAVAPLSEPESDNLLRQAGGQLDYGTHSWVIHQAGGLPRGLLLATQFGTHLRTEAASFVDAIASALQSGLARREGQEAVESLRLLSLLSRTRVRGAGLRELKTVCKLFGGDANAVLRTIETLTDAGFVRRDGDSVEVMPPALANRLASDALRGRSNELLALFIRLDHRGRTRLVARLCSLDREKCEEAAQFRGTLLANNGPLGSLPQVLGNIGLLRELADAEPKLVAEKLRHGIEGMSVEQRYTNIAGDVRLHLKDALVQLLCYQESATDALRSLALLAEAENDTYYSNNATGMLAEAFRWWHPQVALPLHTRLSFLSEIMKPNSNSVEMRLIGLKAVAGALDSGRTFLVRSSRGPRPFDTKAHMTWGNIFDYSDALIGLLKEAEKTDPELQVREAAAPLILQCLLGSIEIARPEDTLRWLERLVDGVLAGHSAVSVSKLGDVLEAALEEWQKITESEDRDIDVAARFRTASIGIQGLIARLDTGPFFLRLRLWTTDWNRRGFAEVGTAPDGSTIYLEDVMLDSLADELIATPFLLTEEVINWLGSSEAQRAGHLMFVVGKRDVEKGCWPLLAAIAGTTRGAAPVASYLQGMSLCDPTFVRGTTVTSFEQGHLNPQAFVFALQRLPADAETAGLVAQIVTDGLVHPTVAAGALLVGEWSDTVAPNDCAIFLRAIAGCDMDNGAVVLDYLSMWLHNKRPIQGELTELAWECLERGNPRHRNDAYDFDRVAAALAPSDLDRAFVLFAVLCRDEHDYPRSGTRWMWKPLDRYGGAGRFWKALRELDRIRFVRTILDLIHTDGYSPLSLHFERAEGAISQEEDIDVLTAYALEGETYAETVCDVLTLRTTGFWPIAFLLLEHYPHNAAIARVLERRVGQMDRPAEGWVGEAEETSDGEVQRVLSDPGTPERARRWLRRVVAKLSSNQDTTDKTAVENVGTLFSYEDSDEEEDDDGDEEATWAAELLRLRVSQQDAERLLGGTYWKAKGGHINES